MSKAIIGVFLISFWLAFPLWGQLLGVVTVEYDRSNFDTFDTAQTPNPITTPFTIAKGYLQLLTMTIPNVPNYLRFVVWSLQFISGLALLLIIRGD